MIKKVCICCLLICCGIHLNSSNIVDMKVEEQSSQDVEYLESKVQSAPVSREKLGVRGATEFVDSINVGWNLGDALESYVDTNGYDADLGIETRWGNPVVTKELIDYVYSLGFNTIRIPVSWYYNSGRDKEGHLVIGEQWLARVHEVVDYAISNEMNVILNTMHDSQVIFRCGVEEEEEWQQIQQDAKDLWTQVADSFKEYDNHLVFEGYNELDNAARGWTYSELAVQQMNIMNQIFVDSVRRTGGNNETRVLLVSTLFHSTKTNMLNAFVLPMDSVEDSLVVSVHAYEEQFDQDIEWIFQSLEDFSNRVGAPVIIDEFGARDDYKLKEWREKFTSNYVARAAEHGIKCCVWDDGYHWKLIDRYDFSKTNMNIINALFDGVNGAKYETDVEDKRVLNSMDFFHFGGMNLATGIVTPVDYVNKYWATLTTKTANGSRFKIEPGNKIAITLIAKNKAVNFWIYGITFFDAKGNVISYSVGKNVTHKYLCVGIPEGAVTYAINTYDPYSNHKLEEIEGYFEQGDLQMIITFIEDANEKQLYRVE